MQTCLIMCEETKLRENHTTIIESKINNETFSTPTYTINSFDDIIEILKQQKE